MAEHDSETSYPDGKAHISEINAILEATYGNPRHGNLDDPLDELIYIKLSQQTNEPKFRSMYSALQRRYPEWQGLEQAAQDELEEILRPGGLHRQRASHLRAMANRLALERLCFLYRRRHIPAPLSNQRMASRSYQSILDVHFPQALTAAYYWLRQPDIYRTPFIELYQN
jgi:HhH-GPD superfamily base excision DNA repair protein